MKVVELVDVIRQLEKKEDLSYDQLKALGIWDEDQGLYERETGNEYKGVMIPRNVYAPKEITLLNAWAKLLGEDNLAGSPFCERTFLRTFLKDVPKEQQWDYIKNTNLYYGKTPELADPNFVLVTRRSLPTEQEKPEAFWSTDPHTTFFGLRYEISAQHRAYSAILVSTIGALKEYGEQDFESISGGASDGEMITSCKPFPRANGQPLLMWQKTQKTLMTILLHEFLKKMLIDIR